MVRYFAYSSLFHLFLALLLIVPAYLLVNKAKSKYYEVDFVGGIIKQSGAQAVAKAVPAPASKQEDFLTKTKKQLKKLITKPAVKQAPLQAQAQPAPVAKAGTGQGEVGLAAEGQGTGGINFPYSWYLRTLRERLLIHWNEIKNLGSEKSCMVVFTVLRDGSISSSKIEKTSLDTFFDRMALRAVSYAEPFPPLPDDFKENELKVHVEFKIAQ